MEYLYDSPNDGMTTFLQAHSAVPRQHDSTSGGGGNYGTGFLYRGNLTKMRRYSVVNGVAGSSIETKTGFYITGTPALMKDGMNHQTNMFYDDSFLHYTEPTPGSLNVTPVTPNPPTFAYPTRVQDPDTFSSTISYNYNFGGVTRTVDPKEYVLNPGNPQTMGVSTYDSKGRRDKALVWKDGTKYSQMRYVYGTDHNYLQTWMTVNTLSEETAVLSLLDGVGRERMRVNEHPGSTGLLSAYYRVYDKMGRVVEWSRPTEISNVTWVPTGDDSGYFFSQQAYDWNGRPTIKTDEIFKTSSRTYNGCGCAGADDTLFTDEMGRRQKIYRDVFGRTTTTEVLRQNNSVYSSTVTAYEVRDLALSMTEYVGTAGSGASQQTLMTYDDHG